MFVERKMPLSVAAKRFVPLTARDKTMLFVSPELTAVQLAPLLVVRNIPLPVPAKRFAPEAAKQLTSPPKGPLVCTHCARVAWGLKNVKDNSMSNWKMCLIAFSFMWS